MWGKGRRKARSSASDQITDIGVSKNSHHRASGAHVRRDISRPPRRSLLGRAVLARHPTVGGHHHGSLQPNGGRPPKNPLRWPLVRKSSNDRRTSFPASYQAAAAGRKFLKARLSLARTN